MCYKEKLSQRASFYTESLLHSSFYTEQTFTWRSFTQIIIYCYTEKLLHRASFYTENMQNSNRNCSYKAESRRQLEKRTTWKHFWIEFKRKIISTKIEKPAAKTPFATLQMETITQRQQRLKKKSPGSLNSNGNAVRHKFDGKATMAETAAHASQLFSAIEPPFADKTPCFVQILTFKSHH